jgi:hypothetical protein
LTSIIPSSFATTIPIWVTFSSQKESSSPYVGYGWTIPFLESRIIQLDENSFKLDQPDGTFRIFTRDSKNPTILTAADNWKAEIRGDGVSAYAPCGTKLSFNKGRIASFENDGRRFDYVYANEQVSEIREGNRRVVRVDSEAGTGIVSGLTFPDGTQVGLLMGQRPVVQSIGGKLMVTRMADGLSKIDRQSGVPVVVEYSVDKASVQPELKIGDLKVAWDAATQLATRVGDWRYSIKAPVGAFLPASIERTSDDGLREARIEPTRFALTALPLLQILGLVEMEDSPTPS